MENFVKKLFMLVDKLVLQLFQIIFIDTWNPFFYIHTLITE